LEASICLGLFYLVYGLLLRKETYFQLNRAYLLLTMLLAVLIPLMRISVAADRIHGPAFYQLDTIRHRISGYAGTDAQTGSVRAPQQGTGPIVTVESERSSNSGGAQSLRFTSILLAIYLIGAGVLILRFVIQLVSLLYHIRKNPHITRSGFTLVDMQSSTVTCSFFHFILVNRRRFLPGDMERILQHESIHIRQYHTLDTLGAQGVAILLWFNPFAWLYCHALRMTHECLADAGVLQAGADRQDYLTQVLRLLIGARHLDVASAMSLHFAEHRIEMMSRQMSKGWAKLKLLAALPVLVVLVTAFAMVITPAPRYVSAAGPAKEIDQMNVDNSPYAPVVIKEAEEVFSRILNEEMPGKDYMWRSYIYTRLACMRTAGWEVDYETLMPVSGYGLSFAYEAKTESGAHFCPPPGTDQRMTQATGFGWEYLHLKDIEDYWQALKETIKSGRPVQACHMEELLFVGFQEAEKKKHRRIRPMAISVFVDPDTWWSWREFKRWFAEFGGPLGRFTRKTEALDDKQVAIETMKALVHLAYQDTRSEGTNPPVACGLAGIEAFARDMADLSMSERHFCSGWFGCHDSNPQWTARQLTLQYLQTCVPLFEEEVAGLIRAAVKDYQRAHGAWLEWDQQLGTHSPRRAWAKEPRRLAGAEAVRRAAQHERDGIEKIRQALTRLSPAVTSG